MKQQQQWTSLILYCLFIIGIQACRESVPLNPNTIVHDSQYRLLAAPQTQTVLVLLPCFSCSMQHTEEEALFLKNLTESGISTILLNINQKLWLEKSDKLMCAQFLQNIFLRHQLPTDKVFIGGFSSGGNVALLLTNYMLKQPQMIHPKGVFVVDSPIDLAQLYENSQQTLQHSSVEVARTEAQEVIQLLSQKLGDPTENFANYSRYSPFLLQNGNLSNIEQLKNIKVRLYTEPALEWQQKARQRTYKELNAYMLEKLYTTLKPQSKSAVEFIQTHNKGVRADGSIHPHSWSIVDRESLLQWLLADS